MKRDRHEHDRNVRAMQVQLLTVGVILLVIASILLGLDLSEHLGHSQHHGDKTNVNIKVSTSCVSTQPTQPPWPIVNGNG